MYILSRYSYDPPLLIKKIYKDFQWNSGSDKILLTFDDGPNPETTELILEELEKLSLHAVFFCVGENIERYPDLAKKILSCGHEIGNHTFKHSRLNILDEKELIYSIQAVQKICMKKLNYRIKYFRPPHGRFTTKTKKILRKNDLLNVMWSLLTYDYKNDLNIVKFAVSKYLSKNSIIVLHDSKKSKPIIKDVINLIVEQAENKKFKIGKPSECLRSYSQ
jgi:peptidoglycan/xylan/chitin deacetylase (PgdA/CDA1 family)